MITRTFTPHPDLLALPFDERMEWVGYMEDYSQAVGCWENHYGSVCCMTALAKGRGFVGYAGGGDQMIDVVKSFIDIGGKNVNTILAAESAHDPDDRNAMGFTVLNDIYSFTFPEISELLKGNTVTKEYPGWHD